MSGEIACTIIARNYLAQARVLADSFSRHHPDGVFHCLILDDPDRSIGDDEPFEALHPEDVIDRGEFASMATMYSIVELATAVKPWLLQFLTTAARRPVAYFDPDIQIFTELADVFQAAADAGIALTPHMLEPPERTPGITAIEDIVLGVGVFNLGFIAVGPERNPLAWWMDRLRADCIIAPGDGRFVDQRWADLMPAYFTPAILRDPGMNVAWWNLSRRRVAADDGGYTVNGHPLRFMHFSGFDPNAPWLVSRHQGPAPQVLMSEEPGLRAVSLAYAQMLREADFDRWSAVPYGLDTAGGIEVDAAMRRAYRDAYLFAAAHGADAPPCLFEGDDRAFVEWLGEPDPLAVGPHPLTRYQYGRWHTDPDLQRAFPDPNGADSAAIARAVPANTGAPPDANAARRPSHHRRSRRANTYRVIAPIEAQTPEGRIARRLIEAMADAGIPHEVTQLASDAFAHGSPNARPADGAVPAVNLFVIEPSALADAAHQVGRESLNHTCNVLMSAWRFPEPTEFPPPGLGIIDEFWACSPEAAARVGGLRGAPPVVVAPLPPAATVCTAGTGAGHVVAIVDLTPGAEPGGADGALAAFSASALAQRGGSLSLVALNPTADVAELERIRFLAGEQAGVTVACDEQVGAGAACLLWLPEAGDAAMPVIDAAAEGIPTIASRRGAAVTMTGDAVMLVDDAAEAGRMLTRVQAPNATRTRAHAPTDAAAAFLVKRLHDLAARHPLTSRARRVTRRRPRSPMRRGNA